MLGNECDFSSLLLITKEEKKWIRLWWNGKCCGQVTFSSLFLNMHQLTLPAAQMILDAMVGFNFFSRSNTNYIQWLIEFSGWKIQGTAVVLDILFDWERGPWCLLAHVYYLLLLSAICQLSKFVFYLFSASLVYHLSVEPCQPSLDLSYMVLCSTSDSSLE